MTRPQVVEGGTSVIAVDVLDDPGKLRRVRADRLDDRFEVVRALEARSHGCRSQVHVFAEQPLQRHAHIDRRAECRFAAGETLRELPDDGLRQAVADRVHVPVCLAHRLIPGAVLAVGKRRDLAQLRAVLIDQICDDILRQ